MADYCTIDDVKSALDGKWGSDYPTGSGSNRDNVLRSLVTSTSRMFDAETGKPIDHFATQNNVTKLYSGGQYELPIDPFDVIDSVIYYSDQTKTQAVTLSTDPVSQYYYVKQPLSGPPYTSLYYAGGFPADAYNNGNVHVTGDIVTPELVKSAVAEWAAYRWNARRAGYADAANRPEGPGLLFVKGIPPHVKRIIDYYSGGESGPKISMASTIVGGTRRDPWSGWRTIDL